MARGTAGKERPRDFTSPKDDLTKLVWTWKRLPADQELPPEQARVRDLRLRCGSNMRQLLIAMHVYHEVHGKFPGPAITDKAGKPLLSWRVALLPYLEESPLHDEFHLDEPWDSAHNLKLLPRMPKIYASVGKEPPTPHSTFIQALVGKDCFFEPGRQNRFGDLSDGVS